MTFSGFSMSLFPGGQLILANSVWVAAGIIFFSFIFHHNSINQSHPFAKFPYCGPNKAF